MANPLNGLVSSEGRISRRAYILGFLLPFVGLCAFTFLMFSLPGAMAGALPATMVTLPWGLFLATADATNIKRWHDLGDPGRLYKLLRPGVVLLPVLAFALQFIFPALAASFGDISRSIAWISGVLIVPE